MTCNITGGTDPFRCAGGMQDETITRVLVFGNGYAITCRTHSGFEGTIIY